MSKAMPKDLKEEIQRVLDECLTEGPAHQFGIRYDAPPLRKAAVYFLSDIRALEHVDGDPTVYRLAAGGQEYWDQMNGPRWYWFRRNWFAASVAGATIVAASVSAGANIANLVI